MVADPRFFTTYESHDCAQSRQIQPDFEEESLNRRLETPSKLFKHHRSSLSKDNILKRNSQPKQRQDKSYQARIKSNQNQQQINQPDLRQVVGLRNTLTCCVLPRQHYGKL